MGSIFIFLVKQATLTVGIVLMTTVNSVASGWNADSLALSIPSSVTKSPEDFAAYLTGNFPKESDKVLALYTWIAYNISYDGKQAETMSRFHSIDDFVLYTLKKKNAVCQGYAEVFTSICNQMGIKALTVHGYNRVNGNLRTDLGHAWNVAKIDGKWHLIDVTWGSGYVSRGNYRKNFTSEYFMASPDSLIESHMPFDPIWQLLEYPISHDQFIEGEGDRQTWYNFSDSLDLYYTQDEIDRAESTLRRAEATHANRREIIRMYRRYSDYLSNMKCNREISHYNESSTTFARAINNFNDFQELLSKRKASPARLNSLLKSCGELVKRALRQARDISPCRSLSAQEIKELINHINDLKRAVSTASRSF